MVKKPNKLKNKCRIYIFWFVLDNTSVQGNKLLWQVDSKHTIY